MRRLLSAALVVGACAAALVLAAAGGEGSGKRTYRIVFDNAFGLVEGGDFRVGGVKAGRTTEFEVEKRPGRATKAVVTAEITEPGLGDFREDASCEILPQSLIGEYYVDCQPGKSSQKLKDGGRVPVEQTASTIPADLVNNILRRPARERLRLILTELGTGLAGRPRDLQEVLRRAHPGLRETSRVLRILGDQNRVIENFIADSDRVVGELERNKRDVARWVVEAGETAEISATRRQELRETFRKLPGFLDELRPTMARLGELADEQTPLLGDLRRAAPDLETFFTRLGPFSEASRPALRSLGRTSSAARRAFREGDQEVDELRTLARDAPPFAKPLRQFVQTIDDRRRAIEDDPRAVEGSPPPPDPTAIRGSGGFTGMESLWNFLFWQSLTINGFDDVAHVLRGGLSPGKCGELETAFGDEPDDPEVYRECNQWLGPNQPGINMPDFTTSAAALRRLTEQPPGRRRIGERRGPGEPEAPALPGQRDISKPQVVLPPQVQELLDRVPRLERPQAGSGGPPSDTGLLDFLLGQ